MPLEFPTLSEPKSQRDITRTFYGYDHRNKIANGSWYDTKNTTAEEYPIFRPRDRWLKVRQLKEPHGLASLNGLAWIDEDKLYYKASLVGGLSLERSDKQIVGMGAYLVIFPDKVIYNTATGELTRIDQKNVVNGCTIEICLISGEKYQNPVTASATAPTDPQNGSYWIDTSTTPAIMKLYGSAYKVWQSVQTTYCKISSPGIGKGIKQDDAVEISGITAAGCDDLNGSHIVYRADDDYIVVTGIAVGVISDAGTITVARTAPDMDYVCEHENRLWGCSNKNHEIYCSALGSPWNWRVYEGLSTDSYAASVGSPGDFTGCIAHGGYVLFFKPDRIHKMYGSNPSNFQLQEISCRGVQEGSSNSLCAVNETLYYKAPNDVVAYTSSIPADISDAFGNEQYTEAWSGSLGDVLFSSYIDRTGEPVMFTYDTGKGLWHRQDQIRARYFSKDGDALYWIGDDGYIWATSGPAEDHPYGNETTELEMPVSWYAITDDIGMESQSNSYVGPMSPDQRYLSKILVRLDVGDRSIVTISIQYDGNHETWQEVYRVNTQKKRSILVPIIPRRHDTVRMKFAGVGSCKIYSFAKTIEDGGYI